MSNAVNMSTVVSTHLMRGENDEETSLLRSALVEARKYLRSFKWVRAIGEEYFGLGVGGVVAVFLFRVDGDEGVDEWLWVVGGDLPSAYLVPDQATTPVEAVRVYCALMGDWAQAVRAGQGLGDVFPVAAEPSVENAALLQKRICYLRDVLLPAYEGTQGPSKG
jgi:hypothetical protein